MTIMTRSGSCAADPNETGASTKAKKGDKNDKEESTDPKATPSELYRNETLCFLATPWPNHSDEVIIETCVNFYSRDEIKVAHKAISDLIPEEVRRRRDDSDTGPNDIVKDIISLLKNTDPKFLPTFVAGNLLKIPSLWNNAEPEAELARALKSLERKFERLAHNTKSELTKVHADIDYLYTAQRDNNNPAPGRNAPVGNRNKPPGNKTPPPTSTVPGQPHQQQQRQQLQQQHDPEEQQRNPEEASRNSSPTSSPVKLTPERSPDAAETGATQPQSSAGKTKPLYSKIASRVIGTGNIRTGLKASPRPYNIYVGGLDADTTPKDVIDHVHKHIGIRVPCKQLHTRNDYYTSFVITVDKNHLERVFTPALWPSEAIIDHYKPPKRRYGNSNNNNNSDNRYNSRNNRYNDFDSNNYYTRQYDEQVYDDDDFKGYHHTGRRNNRYLQRNGDDVDDC